MGVHNKNGMDVLPLYDLCIDRITKTVTLKDIPHLKLPPSVKNDMTMVRKATKKAYKHVFDLSQKLAAIKKICSDAKTLIDYLSSKIDKGDLDVHVRNEFEDSRNGLKRLVLSSKIIFRKSCSGLNRIKTEVLKHPLNSSRITRVNEKLRRETIVISEHEQL